MCHCWKRADFNSNDSCLSVNIMYMYVYSILDDEWNMYKNVFAGCYDYKDPASGVEVVHYHTLIVGSLTEINFITRLKGWIDF